MVSTAMTAAVVGAGYWGPNLARNFHNNADWRLDAICDLDLARAEALASRFNGVRAERELSAVLADPAIDAIAIATPARTHAPLARALMGLRAGEAAEWRGGSLEVVGLTP